MASSGKTSLGLNQWSGTDKIKRVDFNNDNNIVNNKIEDIRTSLSNKVNYTDLTSDLNVNDPNVPFSAAGGYALSQLFAEEYGTWAPVLHGETTAGSPSYSMRRGIYYKIGRLVFLSFVIQLDSLGGIKGDLVIKGIPYPFQPDAAAAGEAAYSQGLKLAEGYMLSLAVGSVGVRLLKQTNPTSSYLPDLDIRDSFGLYSTSVVYLASK